MKDFESLRKENVQEFWDIVIEDLCNERDPVGSLARECREKGYRVDDEFGYTHLGKKLLYCKGRVYYIIEAPTWFFLHDPPLSLPRPLAQPCRYCGVPVAVETLVTISSYGHFGEYVCKDCREGRERK